MKKLNILIVAAFLTACTEKVADSTEAPNGRIVFEPEVVTDIPFTRGTADNVNIVSIPSTSDMALHVYAVVEPMVNQQTIATTRSKLISSLEDFPGFGVSGFSYPNGTDWKLAAPSSFFHNAEAYYYISEWRTSASYYWPAPTNKLTFNAYSPYATEENGLEVSGENETGPLKIKYTVNADPTKQIDLMSASATGRDFNPNTDAASRVPLQFKHDLTAINFQLGDDVAPGYIQSITFRNIYLEGWDVAGQGSWDFSKNALSDKYELTFSGDGFSTEGTETQLNPDDMTLLMIPQTFTQSNQKIELIINDGYPHLLYFDLQSLPKWQAGTRITYVITTKSINIARMEATYPDTWTASGITKNAYEEGEMFGLFAVDKTGNVVQENMKYELKSGKWVSSTTELYNSDYTYYAYYPWKSSLTGTPTAGTNVLVNGNMPTAIQFFNGAISAWTPTNDQGTLTSLVEQDLQIGIGTPTTKKMTISFDMTHAMGLAVLSPKDRDVTTAKVRFYSAKTPTTYHNLSQQSLTIAPSLEFDDVAPCSLNSKLYYIVKGSTPTTISSKTGLYNSWTTDVTVPANSYVTSEVAPPADVSAYTFKGYYYELENAPRTFTTTTAGYYKIECWGAQAGANNTTTYAGGAYTAGMIVLPKNLSLYFYVGQQGKKFGSSTSDKAAAAYNGGGAGTSPYPDSNNFTGGGATDVRLTNGAWNNFASLKSRIMVAAGAGGVVSMRDKLGYAGGLSSPNARHIISGSPNQIWNATGATQISGYQFGTGASGARASGGGGYYGGNVTSSWSNATHDVRCATGGSSFISGHSGCNAIKNAESTSITNIKHSGQSIHYSGRYFTKTVMKAGNESMLKPATNSTTETGHAGNGYARIILPETL